MTKKPAWQRKIQQRSLAYARTVTPGDWAASLCKILIWYGEKHPEAGIDVERVQEILGARPQWRDIRIRRDKSGFDVVIGFSSRHYYTVTNEGLPPIPTSYAEE